MPSLHGDLFIFFEMIILLLGSTPQLWVVVYLNFTDWAVNLCVSVLSVISLLPFTILQINSLSVKKFLFD